jgi:toxin FitB
VSYLVDANVLSEPTKKVPAPQVLDWLRAHDRELVVNPIILGELEFGILRLPASRKRRRLEQWFAVGRASLTVLEFDASTASTWARLLADLRKRGRAMPIKDSLIAATALEHDLTVVTRNVSDFSAAGVKVINPFEDHG